MKQRIKEILIFFVILFFAVGTISLFQLIRDPKYIQGLVENQLASFIKQGLSRDTIHVKIKNLNWGGFSHPYSFKAEKVMVDGFSEKTILQASNLHIGISIPRLILGQIQFSQLKVARIEVEHQGEILLKGSFNLRPYWTRQKINIIGELSNLKDLIQIFAPSLEFPRLEQLGFELELDIKSPKQTFMLVNLSHHQTTGTSQIELITNTPWSDLWAKGGIIDATITAKAKSIPTNDIHKLWPKALAPKPRDWVTNHLSKGIISFATLNTVGQIHLNPQGHLETFKLGSLKGDIQAQDIRVNYLEKLPPVENATGKCWYNDKQFFIEASGIAHGVKLHRGYIVISDLDQEDATIDIDLDNEGSVTNCLEIIDAEPLRFAHDLGLSPKTLQGHAIVHTHLNFPLITDLPLNQVKVTSKAKITDAQFHPPHGLLKQWPLTTGTLDVVVNQDKLEVSGIAHLAKTPISLTWEQYFHKQQAPFKQRFTVDAQHDIHHAPHAEGTILIQATHQVDMNNKAQGKVTANSKDLMLSLPWLGWHKQSGDPITAKITWSHHKNKGKVDIFEITGPELDIRAKGDLTREGLNTLQFSAFRLGKFNPKVKIKRLQNEKYQLKINLPRFDLTSIFKELDQFSQPSSDFDIPLELAFQLTIEEVLTNNHFNLAKCHADIHWVQDHVELIEIKANEKGYKQPFIFRLTPLQENKQDFHLKTNQAGELLELLGSGYNLEKGEMSIAGSRTLHNASWSLQGEMQVKNLIIHQAPLLAQILSLTTLQGIVHTLTGQGLQFDDGHTYFKITPALIELTKAELSGPALGLFFQGQINRERQLLDLTGEIIPIYGVNRLMAGVPLLGRILSGGHDEGIFRTAFTISGPKANPIVKVNPLTTLTPGVVREALKAGQKAIE
jgi:hypothetical protein